MFETQSGGGGLFGRKKRRYGYGDDDGSTPLSAADHDALAAALGTTPVDQIPQKRDFTLFQPVDAQPPLFGPVKSEMTGGNSTASQTIPNAGARFNVQLAPPPSTMDGADPELLQTTSALPENPQISPRTNSAPVFAPVVPRLRMNETVETVPPTAPTAPTAPVYGPRDRVRQAEDRLSEIQNREYGFKKYRQGDQLEPGQTVDKKGYIRDADGKKIPGKDRDKTHNFWDFLRAAGLGALGGLQAGGLGGAIVGAGIGGVGGIIDRNFDNKLQDKMFGIPKAQGQLEQARQAEEADTRQRVTDAQVRNIDADNQYQRDRLDEARQDRLRKEDDRKSRERTARMTQVAGILKNLPEYDPNDPKFAELTKALGDVDLPITPKDAKKQVKLIQDQQTGAWTTVLTDPVSGKEEVRPVMKDGKQLATTPEVVMAGEYGLTRQTNQQEFTRTENEKNRQLEMQKQQIAGQLQIQLKVIEGAQAEARQAKTLEAQKAAKDKEIEAQKEYIRLRAEAKKLEEQ